MLNDRLKNVFPNRLKSAYKIHDLCTRTFHFTTLPEILLFTVQAFKQSLRGNPKWLSYFIVVKFYRI